MNESIKNNRIIRYLYYYTKSIIKKDQLVAAAKKVILKFGIQESPEKEAILIKDMLKMYSRYGFGFDEYLYFSFYNKSLTERLSFIADWEHLGYACALNTAINNELFDNKWKTYKKYHRYYGRNVLFCDIHTSVEQFNTFLNRNDSFIIKPLDLSCGNGVKIITQSAFDETERQMLFQNLIKEYNGRFIVEDLIKQSPEMAKLHPASVNTVRVPTIRLEDKTIVFNPFLRIGLHGNHVDNAGAGGIICTLDADTGVVFAAANEYGARFDIHPDTKEKIIGFTIPRWEEAKEFVKDLAQVTPDNRYTGWDIALTEQGWIMVEGNRRGQFVWQIASQKGSRKEMNAILKELNKKY